MKNKKGFVTISLVLWLSLSLSIVSALYMTALRKYSLESNRDKVDNYKNHYAYYDVIEEFERIINAKLVTGELEFINIKNEVYFLETKAKEYKVSKEEETHYFLLEVKDKKSGEVFNERYNQILKGDGSVFFVRRTVNEKV